MPRGFKRFNGLGAATDSMRGAARGADAAAASASASASAHEPNGDSAARPRGATVKRAHSSSEHCTTRRAAGMP